MRIVVFTAYPTMAHSAWWPVLLATPGLEAVLVLRKAWRNDPISRWRRFQRNVLRNGPIYVPYRIGVLVIDLVRRGICSSETRAAGIDLPEEAATTSSMQG